MCWLVPIRADSKSCAMSSVRGPARLAPPPGLASTPSVWGCPPCTVSPAGTHTACPQSSWLASHGSRTSRMLWPLSQSRHDFHIFEKWPLRASMQGLHLHMPAYTALPNHGRRFHNPFTPLSFRALKPEPLPETAKFEDLL